MKTSLPRPLATFSALCMLAATLSAADQADLQSLRVRAEAGDAAAQAALAVRYRDGKGVAKDDAEAMKWAHRAADAGNTDAMDFVGFAYLRGAVVKRNPVVAFGYFKAAAEKSAAAAFNLGQCYYGAQGTEQDCAKALDWWKSAAERGHGRAASTAAMAYLSGEGIERDVVRARRFAEHAAELNDPSGLIVLGEMQFRTRRGEGKLDARLEAPPDRSHRPSRAAVRPRLRAAGSRPFAAHRIPSAKERAGQVRLRADAAHPSGLQQLRG
jgi:uncharacterized protein